MNNKYTIRFSGHGSNYSPRNFNYQYSLEEARKIEKEWEIRADTIGGSCLIELVEK